MGCCDFLVSLIRYRLSLPLIVSCLRVLSLSGTPFLVSLLPTHMRPKHRDSVAGWYPAVQVSVFSSGVTFSGAPLPTPVRSKHKYSVDGWCSVHMSVFSSGATFLMLHHPRPLRPKHGDSVAGWYPAVSVRFSLPKFGCYLLWSPFLCPLRSLALVFSAHCLSDSGPTN